MRERSRANQHGEHPADVVRPKGANVPASVLLKIWDTGDNRYHCRSHKVGCGVLVLDIDRDDQVEFIFISSTSLGPVSIYDVAEDSWVRLRSTVLRHKQSEVWQHFKDGDYALVKPPRYDLRLGEELFRE